MFKVMNGLAKKMRVVTEQAERQIMGATEKSPDLSGLMVMIYRKFFVCWRFAADGTLSALFCVQPLKVFNGNPALQAFISKATLLIRAVARGAILPISIFGVSPCLVTGDLADLAVGGKSIALAGVSAKLAYWLGGLTAVAVFFGYNGLSHGMFSPNENVSGEARRLFQQMSEPLSILPRQVA